MSWPTVTFSDVFKDVSGGNAKVQASQYLETGLLPVIDQGASQVAGYIDNETLKCKAALPCIVFGDHTKAIKFVDKDFAMGADGTKVLVPDDRLDAKYAYHALQQFRFPAKTGYMRHYKYLKRAIIPLPPLPEQKRIAAILDKADAIKRKRQQSIRILDDFLRATFLDMFGDPVTNPKGWEVKTLTDLVPGDDGVKCGPFGTQLAKDEYSHGSGIPLWGIKHVNKSFSVETSEFVNHETAIRLNTYSVIPGDIVMTRKGTIGNAAIYPLNFTTGVMHSDLLRIRPVLNLVSTQFLWAQLTMSPSVEAQIRVMSPGAVMPGINVGKLKHLKLLVPPLTIQREFAAILQAVEKQKATLQRHATESETLSASLQDRAFKGAL